MSFYVYIVTNWKYNVMYTGLTDDLDNKMYEHKNKLADAFTTKYNVNKLVYYELIEDAKLASNRVIEIRGWTRKKKNALVETLNAKWKDLSSDFREPDQWLRKSSFTPFRISQEDLDKINAYPDAVFAEGACPSDGDS